MEVAKNKEFKPEDNAEGMKITLDDFRKILDFNDG